MSMKDAPVFRSGTISEVISLLARADSRSLFNGPPEVRLPPINKPPIDPPKSRTETTIVAQRHR
jgi:hypothetical protein